MFFYTFMPKLFNMSLTASVAIVLVILLRLMLKKAPKVISYAVKVLERLHHLTENQSNIITVFVTFLRTSLL